MKKESLLSMGIHIVTIIPKATGMGLMGTVRVLSGGKSKGGKYGKI